MSASRSNGKTATGQAGRTTLPKPVTSRAVSMPAFATPGLDPAFATSEAAYRAMADLALEIGNRALQALLLRAAPVASSALEEEADLLAAQALRVAVTRCLTPTPAHALSPQELARAPPVIAAGVRSASEPLDSTLRNYFEPRLGVALDRVRIHTDALAGGAARAFDAAAFTFGEHVLFDAHAFAPHTRRGRELLAHELAHVAQQSRAGVAFLGRRDWRDPKRPGEVVTELKDFPGYVQRSGPGYIVLDTIELEYLRIEWDPKSPTPNLEVAKLASAKGFGMGLRITSDTELKVTLDRTMERGLYDSWMLYSYDFQARGNLHVKLYQPTSGERNERDLKLPWRHRELIPPQPYGETPPPIRLDPPTPDELEPLKNAPKPIGPADQRQAEEKKAQEEQTVRGHRAFKSQKEMEAYIKANPAKTFIGIETTYGKFVAREIGEGEMISLATQLRADQEILPEVAWDVGKKRSAWGTTGVYRNGRQLDLSTLRNRYYGSAGGALEGLKDDFEECEVYRMGKSAYGRKPLSHTEANERWRALDKLETKAIERLETEPGHAFFMLRVRGVGKAHDVGIAHYRGRDEFLATAAAVRGKGYDYYQILKALESTKGDVYGFIMAEVDRDEPNEKFVAALRAEEQLAVAVDFEVYHEIKKRAQAVALKALDELYEQLAPIAEDPQHAAAFCLGFADLESDKQRNALKCIGIPDGTLEYALERLNSREGAMRIALGLEESRTTHHTMKVVDDLPSKTREHYSITTTFSLAMLQKHAGETVKSIDDGRKQIKEDDELALWLEGDLGIRVRKAVYDEFGFRVLKPDTFPHVEETKGKYPGPMAPGEHKFTSLMEQMYANRMRSENSRRKALRILKVIVGVILGVILILIAQAAGAVIAGMFLAEGSALFIATELVASGVIFTGLEAVQHRLATGEWEAPTEIVGNAIKNIVTFGVFKYLNTALAAGAKSFAAAGVRRGVFAASREGMWATGLRIGMMGSAVMGIGIGQRLASGQGFKSGEDFALFAFENLLSIALLEAGAVLARPLIESGTIWAREFRLGKMKGPLTDFRGDLARLQAEMSSMWLRPEAASRDAPRLGKEATRLLNKQAELASQLRETFRTRSDAAELDAKAGKELEDIKAAIAGIEQAEFLNRLKIRPVGESESVYSFEGGESSVADIRKFYGEDRVQAQPDGSYRVEVPGLPDRFHVYVPVESLGTATIATRQAALAARQRAVLARAKLLGVDHSSLNDIALAKLRVGRTTDPKKLDAAEQKIARAEREAGGEMNELTQNIFNNIRRKLGPKAIEQIRAGALKDVSDTDLAAIMWQARKMPKMGVAQYRALAFAAQEGKPAIDFRKLMRVIRKRFKVADRNFALETFAQMMEQRVGGTRQMMADMQRSRNAFRGGLFQMEAITYVGGADKVAKVETREAIDDRAREYDITMRSGKRIECKDWSTWEHAPSLADQFIRDMHRLTSTRQPDGTLPQDTTGTRFRNPAGMRDIGYLFRRPSPVPVEQIRSYLREELVRALNGQDASIRDAMLREFDAYKELVEAPELQRTGPLALGKPRQPTIAPKPITGDDDDDEDQIEPDDPDEPSER